MPDQADPWPAPAPGLRRPTKRARQTV